MSSQLHSLANDVLQLRGELTAFMSHSGYRARVCDPSDGDPPDLDLGWIPLNKRRPWQGRQRYSINSRVRLQQVQSLPPRLLGEVRKIRCHEYGRRHHSNKAILGWLSI